MYIHKILKYRLVESSPKGHIHNTTPTPKAQETSSKVGKNDCKNRMIRDTDVRFLSPSNVISNTYTVSLT